MSIVMKLLLFFTYINFFVSYPVSLGPKAGIMYTRDRSPIYFNDQPAGQSERALMPLNSIQNPWHRKQGIEQQFVGGTEGNVEIVYI